MTEQTAGAAPRYAPRSKAEIEAHIAGLNPDPEQVFADSGADVQARAEALVRSMMAVLFADPRPFRELEHLQLEMALLGEKGPVRRRMQWVDRVLEPGIGTVPAEVLAKLRLTIPLLFGTEALLTQLDICRSEPGEATDAMAWVAGTQVRMALADHGVTNPGPSAAHRPVGIGRGAWR